MGIPEDQQMKTLTNKILERINDTRHRINTREKGFPGNTREMRNEE